MRITPSQKILFWNGQEACEQIGGRWHLPVYCAKHIYQIWKAHTRKATLAKQNLLATSCIDSQRILSAKTEVLSGLQNLSDIAPNALAHDEVDTYMSEM